MVRRNKVQPTPEFLSFEKKAIGAKPLCWPARRVGSRVKGLLALPGFSGKVLAVLSTTIYLEGRDGEILWVSREGLPMHRRSILTSFHSDSICVGQNFFTQGPYLRIAREANPDPALKCGALGSPQTYSIHPHDKSGGFLQGGVTIDLDQAIEWKPLGVVPEHAQPLSTLNVCVRRLLEAVVKLGNAKGLGQTTLLISAVVDGNEMAIFPQDSLLARVRGSIFALARACLKEDMVQVTQIGREFVGLGPGLTPSGDDFLGGLLFAAHTLKTAYPEDFDWEQEPVMGLIDWARTETHPISHAILSDLALGYGPEPLHEVVTSLLKGQNLDHAMAGVTRLIEIGDTSGWDILAGMLTGMLLIAGKPR